MSIFPLPRLCVHTFCKYLLSDSVSVSAQKLEFVRVVCPDPRTITCKTSCLRVKNTWLAIRGGDGSVISCEQPLALNAAREPHVALFPSKRTAEALMRRHFFSPGIVSGKGRFISALQYDPYCTILNRDVERELSIIIKQLPIDLKCECDASPRVLLSFVCRPCALMQNKTSKAVFTLSQGPASPLWFWLSGPCWISFLEARMASKGISERGHPRSPHVCFW